MKHEDLAKWANDPSAPVALVLRQPLMPVEGHGQPVFPPTYANIGYNDDRLEDGTKTVTIDSVGSQANRIEPIFAEEPYAELVPDVTITFEDSKDAIPDLPLLEAGHRLADAIVRCTELGGEAEEAFHAYLQGDPEPIARLAPTSLIFGFWDSRGTQAKAPRVVQSNVRAWDVSTLRRSAQFWSATDYAALGVVSEAEVAKGEKSPLASRGFVDTPAVDALGGVVAAGPIERTLSVNLIALRNLGSSTQEDVRNYLLGLALVSATAPMDGFFRQGCLLVPHDEEPATWQAVQRTGEREALDLTHDAALGFARDAAKSFGVEKRGPVRFDVKLARADAEKAKKKKK